MYLFDRARTAHSWQVVLDEPRDALTSVGCVAWNWRMDHRVSPEREEDMLKDERLGRARPATLTDWHNRVRSFHQERVQMRSYVDPFSMPQRPDTVNGHNVQNRLVPTRLAPHDELIHLASFNRLVGWLINSKTDVDLFAGDEELNRLVPPADRAAVKASWIDQLARNLAQADASLIQRAAGVLVRRLYAGRAPWWATFAQEAQPWIAAKDWIGLCKALGMGHFFPNEWLMVWRYPVEVVGDLYRPTVVEAGIDPNHFPSPPGSDVGVVMNLDVDQEVTLREVVHLALRPEYAQHYCMGQLVCLQGAPYVEPERLPDLRQRHWHRLADEFMEEPDRAWFARHG